MEPETSTVQVVDIYSIQEHVASCVADFIRDYLISNCANFTRSGLLQHISGEDLTDRLELLVQIGKAATTAKADAIRLLE